MYTLVKCKHICYQVNILFASNVVPEMMDDVIETMKIKKVIVSNVNNIVKWVIWLITSAIRIFSLADL